MISTYGRRQDKKQEYHHHRSTVPTMLLNYNKASVCIAKIKRCDSGKKHPYIIKYSITKSKEHKTHLGGRKDRYAVLHYNRLQ